MTKTPPARRATQLDLFRRPPSLPAWGSLPMDVQRKVKALLARMLREHRTLRPGMRRSQQEVCDE